MNDRFKFRAWDTEEKKMILPSAEDVTDNEVICFNGTLLFVSENPVEDTAKVRFFEHNRLILMQCTGLKDKEGKLIFEGDIIQYMGTDKQQIAIITYKESAGYVGMVLKEFYLSNHNFDWATCSLGSIHAESEIIGNIYENPELLNPT